MKQLSQTTQLDTILKAMPKDVLIFKHSFRCSISVAMKNRLEAADLDETLDVYLLDVIECRPLSLALAERTGIIHQSPQVLLFRASKCIYSASHFDINKQAILSAL